MVDGDKVYIDAGDLYGRAAEVTERALVIGSPTNYGLGDLVDDDESALWAIFQNMFLTSLVVQGTLTGCIAALSRPEFDGLARLSAVSPAALSVPAPGHVSEAQFVRGHGWLVASIAGGLDDGARSELIDADVSAWYTSTDWGTGQVLGLVLVADAALNG